jgi:hypothetical protein
VSSTAEALRSEYEQFLPHDDRTAWDEERLTLLKSVPSGESRNAPDDLVALVARWNVRQRSRNLRTIERMRNLRAVLGRLEGVSFSDAATLLNTSEKRLEAWLHDDESVPVTQESRIHELAGVLVQLERIMERPAFGIWLTTPIPAWGGRTPIEALRRRQSQRVRALIDSYLDPSFG